MARNSLNQTYDVCEAPRPVGRTQMACTRLSEVNDRLLRALESTEAFGDRMLGTQPAQVAAGKPDARAVPNGTLEILHDEISRAETLASRLRGAIDRLAEID